MKKALILIIFLCTNNIGNSQCDISLKTLEEISGCKTMYMFKTKMQELNYSFDNRYGENIAVASCPVDYSFGSEEWIQQPYFEYLGSDSYRILLAGTSHTLKSIVDNLIRELDNSMDYRRSNVQCSPFVPTYSFEKESTRICFDGKERGFSIEYQGAAGETSKYSYYKIVFNDYK